MPEVDRSKVNSFANSEAFAAWLESNHEQESELWMKIYKKDSEHQSIDWGQAVIEALCWGWIDGVKKSLDSEAYLQRFTPRRRGSPWSKRNCEHIERLVSEGRMREPGLVHVREAKADGRWDAAYSPQSEMEMPADFLTALDKSAKAKTYFESLSKSKKYTIFHALQTARTPETRVRRLDKYLSMLQKNEPIK
jgi:uncharacterized protein YdeI (YjbR/CyaY-like superfamily)